MKKTFELKIIYRILIQTAAIALIVLMSHFMVFEKISHYIELTGYISFLLTASYCIYLFVVWLITRNVSMQEKYIFLIIYSIMFMALLFSRDNGTGHYLYINLKIGYFKDASPLIKYANLLILAPIGFAVRSLFKTKLLYSSLACVVSITILEILQYLTKKGTFDINDIILNTMGFIIGASAIILYRKHRKSEL